MSKDAPAFDFYPERFWFAVEGWTESETCRYWRLLSQQWMRDGLPADEKELAGLARGKLSERVLDKFPLADDGKRRNPFLEQLRNEQRDRIARRRDGAAKTNAKRWAGKSDSESPSDRSATRLATRLATIERVDSESPPPTTHHNSTPHTPHAPAHDGSLWPDPSEYPTLETVKAWAVAVMAPPECAEKWHAERCVEGWMTKGGRPMTADAGPLRNLFSAYATAWKANASKVLTGRPPPPPKKPTEKSDVNPHRMRDL
jgi:hypothetical protein